MARGTWDESNIPTIPGFYNRMKQKAIEASMSSQGVLAMPVRSNWGQKETVVSITSIKQLKNVFGDSMDFTAYKLGRLALLGAPKELLLYRVVDSDAAKGTLKLKNADSTDVITLTTLYESSREFKITIAANIVNTDKLDITFYEGTAEISSVQGVTNTIDAVVTAINKNFNEYVVAEKVADATGTLATVTSAVFTGGNNGSANCTVNDYAKAMTAFESYDIDGFTLDGVSDEALINAVQEWKNTIAESGIDVLVFSSTNESTIAAANTVSKGYNDKSMHNGFATTLTYDGVEYSIAEAMVYVAGLALGQKLTESLCNQETIFTDVQPRLSRSQIESALEAGTMVFTISQGKVVIVDDVNTYKNYASNAEKVLGNLRAVKFINNVNKNTSLKGEAKYVGKISNDDTGHALILSGIKVFFDEWQAQRIISSYTVETDEDMQKTAEADQYFWKWDAAYVEVTKRIFGTGNLQYASN